MAEQEIKIGFTNKKYRNGDKFILMKNHNAFNHHITYKVLAAFDFVPRLLEETKEKLVWEFIEGDILRYPTDQDLKELGRIMRTIHKSNLKFPKNNLRQRMQKYLHIIHAGAKAPPEIENNYRPAVKLLARMGKLNPCHNDIWRENIIKDPQGKLWLVDWEYASMGDKHFDLAYFMEAYYLDPRQKRVFLKAYNAHDDYGAYIPEWLDNYERFVNYLTLCWALAQDKVPFALDKITARLNQLKK